ncbi:hypothetical protein ABIF70_005219 [Bradyrhizobium japonicum]
MDSDRLAATTSFDDLLREIAAIETGLFPDAVWHAAAIARHFDAELFKRCAVQATTPGVSNNGSFEAFTAHADVVRLDEKRVRLSSTARERILRGLADDKPASLAAGRQIYESVSRGGNALDQFAVQLVVEPSVAADRLDQLYAEADARFDLSGCDALLEIMRERASLLDPMLREMLTEKEQYLSSRLLFVDEYYRTVSYFEHGDLLAKFKDLVAPALFSRLRTQRWLLDLYGKGGIGKTMFRRWVVARHCLPSSSPLRTPVARVDIDFVYRALLISQPWLVLLPIATQLRPQLADAPFSDMLGPEQVGLRNLLLDRTTVLRTQDQRALVQAGELLQPVLEDRFCQGLEEAKAVVIFDTLEELSVHQPPVLASLLEMLDRLHKRCPGLRVVLSGRYRIFDPKKPLKELKQSTWDEMLRACIDVPVERLNKSESRRFLTEMRHLGNDQPLAEIIKKSDGNPFVLALFADLASGRTLAAEEVRTSNVAFAYLIERIIDRIPDEEVVPGDSANVQRHKYTQRGLRWLLRYAVVPRRLTRKFVYEVLADFILDELHDKTHRDDTSLEQAGARYTRHDRWRRSAIPVAFDDLWAALQSYASSSSWVNGSGDELELQPEIVVPMRQLLTQKVEKYPIWIELQKASAEYFERLASTDGALGKHLQEALFHRYQAQGAAASEWFDHYLKQCQTADNAYTEVPELCDSLFGEDYLDPDQLPIQHFTGAIIAPETLGAAALESFLALVIRRLLRPNKIADAIRTTMEARLAIFKRYGGTGARAELARIAAAVYGLEPELHNNWPNPALTELLSSDERVAYALLTAKRSDLPVEAKRHWHEQAVTIAEQQSRPNNAFQPYFVRAQLAMFDARTGNHESAFKLLRENLSIALKSGAPAIIVSDLLLQAGDLGYALGHWVDLEDLAGQAVERPYPAHEEATNWLIQIALNRYDYERVQSLIDQFQSNIEPARQEFLAELYGATFRFSEAERNYSAARAGYMNLQFASAAAQTLLNYTRFLLDVVGSTRRAAEILAPLAGSRSFPEPIIELQMNMLRLRINARTGETARARRHLDRILELLEHEPQLAPTYATAAIATLLAEGAGNTSDAADLARTMARMSTSARLMALRPFLFAAPGAQLAFDIDLLDKVPGLAVHDRLCLAAANIFFGETSTAATILQSIIDSKAKPEIVAVALRLARRIAPDAVEPPSDWVITWAEQGKKQPGLAGIILLEEAERLVAVNRIARARQALAIAKAYFSDLPSDSRWNELLINLDAATTKSGPGLDLETALATLPADRLLRPVSVLSIGLDEANRIEMRFRDALKGAEVIRSPMSEELIGALATASTTNDLYPPKWAQVLNEAPALDEGLIGRLWRKLSGAIPESQGSATLRIRVTTVLNDLMGTRSALGYAWNRGSLAPIRRTLSKPAAGEGVPQQSPSHSMIAVETTIPAAATVPWELGHSGSEPFFRSQHGVALPDTLLHLRRAIAMLRQSGDPLVADTWDEVIYELGGPGRFRHTVRERLHLAPPRRVLILSADAETQRRQRSGYGTSGLRLEDVYRQAGFEVATLPLDAKTVLSRLDRGQPPDVIHVSARVLESFQPPRGIARIGVRESDAR